MDGTDISCCFIGAGGRSRTLDLRITNALLYRLSYTGLGGAFFEDAREGNTVNPGKHSSISERHASRHMLRVAKSPRRGRGKRGKQRRSARPEYLHADA